MTWTIEPVPTASHQGRQYGWHVLRDGQPVLECSQGGTGPCWNVAVFGSDQDYFHVCDLDEMVGALQALAASDAHKQNVGRWSDD